MQLFNEVATTSTRNVRLLQPVEAKSPPRNIEIVGTRIARPCPIGKPGRSSCLFAAAQSREYGFGRLAGRRILETLETGCHAIADGVRIGDAHNESSSGRIGRTTTAHSEPMTDEGASPPCLSASRRVPRAARRLTMIGFEMAERMTLSKLAAMDE